MSKGDQRVDYGRLLRRRVREAWQQYNLDYDYLLGHLTSVKKTYGMKRAVSTIALRGETRTFAEILDGDVEKIVLFYLRQQGEVAARLWALRERQALQMQYRVTKSIIEGFCMEYRALGTDVLDLLEYLDSNVNALRRIIKKHDKHFDLQMGRTYFGARMGQNSQLVQLYHQEGLYAIIGTIRRGFEHLYSAKHQLGMDGGGGGGWGGDMHDNLDVSEPVSRRSSGIYFDGDNDSKRGEGLRQRAGSFNSHASGVKGFGGSGTARAGLSAPRLGARPRFQSSTALHAMLKSGGHPQGHGTFGDGPGGKPKDMIRNFSSAFLALLSPSGATSSGAGAVGRKGQHHDGGFGGGDHSKFDPAELLQLEPIISKIDEASLKVLKSQKDSVNEYVAVHSTMGLELAVRDMDDSDSDSDDEDDRYGADEEAAADPIAKARRAARKHEKDARRGRKKKLSERVTSQTGLFLALFTTLLYQMNQYVVAPTSAQYSDLLGMSPHLSGLIIGLSPFAALLSALLFSVWTNYSFRQPLIVCLLLLGTGNLFYALALQCNSTKMLFIGRLMTGLGVPRGIARRYIADHVSLADRTEASSHFVTAGAMGLALGPLLSSLVSASRVNFTWMWGGVTIVRYELVTAPGWLMAVLFYATLIVLVVVFEEPYIDPATSSGATKQGLSGSQHGRRQPGRRGDGSAQGSAKDSSRRSQKGAPSVSIFGSLSAATSLQDVAAAVGASLGLSAKAPRPDASLPRASESSPVSTAQAAQPRYGAVPTDDVEVEMSGRKPDAAAATSATSGSAAGVPKVLSLDDIAKMARSGDVDLSPSGALTGAAHQILTRTASQEQLKPVASSNTSVKFATSTDRGGRTDDRSDAIASDSGYTHYSIPSEASSQHKQQHADPPQSISFASLNAADCQGSPDSVDAAAVPIYESLYYVEPDGGGGGEEWLNGGEVGSDCRVGSCPSWACWCCDVLGDEVVVILVIYLVNKIGQEMVVSSVPSLSLVLFGWDAQRCGFFMAAMGSLVLPFNIVVSKLAKDLEDRSMMAWLNYLSLFSVVFILPMPFLLQYSSAQYVCGSIMIFVFLNALEGVIMSLLSKLVSPELARGTWNSGLLATEAGTFGRVVGDVMITAFSSSAAADTSLVSTLFSPIAIGLAAVIGLCALFHDRMEV